MPPPPLPIDPPPDPIVFSKWRGLNNVVEPERLTTEDLASAVNIDLDDVGQPHRRRGHRLVVAGDFHSLFTTDNGEVYGVKDGSLVFINTNFTTVALASNIYSDPFSGLYPLAYTQIGPLVYFSSAQASGIIDTQARSVGPWGQMVDDFFFSPVVNPTANLPAIRGKLLGKPPLATSLTNFNGRIYLGQGNLVWVTELYAYGLVDRTRGYYQFEGQITMLGTVNDGVYVGTTEGLWFLSGVHATGMKRVRVLDTGVIPNTMVYIPAELANPPQTGLVADTPIQVSIGFMTQNGFCVAEDSGQAYNMTESKFFFPTANRGASMYRRQDGMNTFVTVLDSGGSPVNSARIGDYASAELVRAGSWLGLDDNINIGDSYEATVVSS